MCNNDTPFSELVSIVCMCVLCSCSRRADPKRVMGPMTGSQVADVNQKWLSAMPGLTKERSFLLTRRLLALTTPSINRLVDTES